MNQLCKVCAEPAAGFHFGAFTCEGCKSFFGRTYNNLSQIHECKNGGTCVINKQNRTSCKACRLRKCLYVGMSKSGSRYGRRSNWFKIHCLLQEQAGGLQNQSINLRAPVTPTLQDGSLPFVATQLREPGMGSDSPAVTTMNFSSTTTATCLSNPSLTTDIGSAARMLDVHRMGSTLPVNFSPLLLPGEINLQDKSGCRQPSSSPSSIESSYNEHLYNLIQRRHGIDSLWNATSLELDGESRRLSPDLENRLGPMAFLEWKKRLSEATKRAESSDHDKIKSHSPRRDDNENITEGSDDERKYDEFGKSELKCNTNSNAIKTEIKIDVESSDIQSKQKELLQRFKENEKLLTGNDSSLLAKTTTSFPLYTQPHEKINPLLKFPGREDMFYNPVRSNLFSFPPYPPLWPSIIPFTQFPKIYEPFCPPRLPNTANINCLKPPIFPLVNLPDSRNISPSIPKDDSNTKKRNLDAILQFQRENYSPNSNPDQRTYSPPSLTPPIPKTNSQFINTDPPLPNPPTDVPKNPSEQPIDLTVRRKRKMPKSEIVYKPEEVDDIVNESSKDCEEKVSDHLQIKVSEIKNSNLEDDFELPMKAIKLETTKETLAV